ncbi:MAG: hypothetical protein JXB04_02375 [Kiritimatiellae bacterium]|nr:hypothetical protein [Kiritimatiellia bacterium]
MKGRVARLVEIVSLGLLLLSPAARGQAGPDPMQGQRPVPMVGSEFRFVSGSWAVYLLKGRDDPQEQKLYFAVLDEVKQRGGTAWWIEMEVYTNDQPAVVTRMLVPDTGAGPGDAQKAYVQIAGYRPFEVPRKYLRPDPRRQQEQVGEFANYDLAGRPAEQTIQWKGRSLKAATVDLTDAEGGPTTIVISEDAPPLCVVKLDSPDMKMELADWGAGAETKIVGQPVGMWRWIWGVIVQAGREAGAGTE